MSGNRIVVGYDGSPAGAAAAEWAAVAASRWGRRLRIVHAIGWPIPRTASGTAMVAALDQIRTAVERLLDRACRDIRAAHPDLAIEAEVVVGAPVPALVHEATTASVLVLGSRGLGELRDLAAGSVMAHLATHAPCPVVVVPAGWPESIDVPDEIVVGVDGSELSTGAIGFAFRYAEVMGGSVTALMAWQDPQSIGPGDIVPAVYDIDALEQDSAAVLGEALAGQATDHPDVKATEKLVRGPAANVLVDASRHARLLVVGSRGRGRFRGLLLGSVSRAVLHHAQCPVAVVRTTADGKEQNNG
jgi:nucleotide-binding universal stress UspA family protein